MISNSNINVWACCFIDRYISYISYIYYERVEYVVVMRLNEVINPNINNPKHTLMSETISNNSLTIITIAITITWNKCEWKAKCNVNRNVSWNRFRLE